MKRGVVQVQLADLKSGNMRLDIHEARREKRKLTDEQQKALAGKDKAFPRRIEPGKWHDLLVKIEGDELSAEVDRKPAGSFRSPGIAHSTKRMLRLAVPHNAVVEDVMIYRGK